MDRYDDKKKRAVRRRNHVARDLADRKYRQRRIEKKKEEDIDPFDYLEDLL